jgi:hypothetical protein
LTLNIRGVAVVHARPRVGGLDATHDAR